MGTPKDNWFGADKFQHFVLHLVMVVVLCLFMDWEGALGISILFGVAWEVKDKAVKPRLVYWPWLLNLTGQHSYNIGGHDQFSGKDLLWNLAGALTVYVLRSWCW